MFSVSLMPQQFLPTQGQTPSVFIVCLSVCVIVCELSCLCVPAAWCEYVYVCV
jgi:hypothetical protein